MLKLNLILISFIFIPIHSTASEKIKFQIEPRISMEFETRKFTGNDITNCGDYICKINNSIFFGSDGKIPNEEAYRFQVEIEDIEYTLNVDGMYDPKITKEDFLERIEIAPYWGGFYKVTGYFSDGAGAYVAQWTIGNSTSFRNFLGKPEDLFELSNWLENIR